MVFRSSYSLASALLVVALLFTLLVVFLEVITRSQRRDKSLTKNLLLRRIVVGLVLILLIGLLVFSSAYLLTKRLVLTPDEIQLATLCGKESLSWDEIQSVRGNFVSGTKISPVREQTAWLEIQLVGGETENWDLRFLRGVNRLPSVLSNFTTVLP